MYRLRFGDDDYNLKNNPPKTMVGRTKKNMYLLYLLHVLVISRSPTSVNETLALTTIPIEDIFKDMAAFYKVGVQALSQQYN